MTEIWLAFLAGLAGSAHCVGMCGGIVTAIAMAGHSSGTSRGWRFQLLYNLGRITTYASLGFAAGLIGSSFNLLSVRSVSLWFFVAANGFVLLVGLGSVFGVRYLNISALDGSCSQLLGAPLRWALGGSGALRAFPLGMALGFLPCGLVYSPLATAAGTGSPLLGGAIMTALGLGTLPLLFIFGVSALTISARMRTRFFRLAGFLLALMGLAGLWRVLGKMEYLPPFPF